MNIKTVGGLAVGAAFGLLFVSPIYAIALMVLGSYLIVKDS